MENKSPKLLDQVRQIMRREHYAIRTEQSYANWIKRRFVNETLHPLSSQAPSPGNGPARN